MLLHEMLWEGQEAVDMKTVQPYGFHVPRRRDGRLHRRQVFVWERKDEMCSMTQTRVKALEHDMCFSTTRKGEFDCYVWWHIYRDRL